MFKFKEGDKVNVSLKGENWTTDELYYVGMKRNGDYVIENIIGVMTCSVYCRPFEEKITYNVWRYQDSNSSLLTIKENEPQPSNNWKIIHTFTI